jgi:ribose transport system ATP-binding protein
MSVRDNLMLGAGFPCRFGTVRDRAADREAREILKQAGVDVGPGQLVSHLTSAQRTGVAVARALRRDASVETKVLVLDEPTATLPEAEVSHLLAVVRAVAAGGVGVIYVTHRLSEVPLIADTITVLRDGAKVATAAGGISRHDLVHLLVGSELDETSDDSASLRPSGTPLLRVEGITAGPLEEVSFQVHAGEVVGVAGVTGSGRETILATLFGGVPRLAGSVSVRERKIPGDRPWEAVEAGIGYLPADRKSNGGIMDLTARENLTLAELGSLWKVPFLRRKLENEECRRWFDELNVRPSGRINDTLDRFSGGNQQKLLLAKWLRRGPEVLLLDEPTQGVDIASKAEIHQRLIASARAGAAIVVSSSDVDELAAVCTRVLVLRRGRLAADLVGDEVKVKAISREAHG